MIMKTNLIAVLISIVLLSCDKTKNEYDASGAFETEETIISSEATGAIKQFDLEEGQTLKAGDHIGYIDSTQLYLRKKQLETQVGATLSQKPNIPAQIAALQVQLSAAEKDQQRYANLRKDDIGTQKQYDDITAQVEVIKKQIEALKTSLTITSESVDKQTNPLRIQIEQINDQLHKCNIINPINGVVLTKYVEPNEMAVPGKPLYKIADLSFLYLRAYITGAQLSQIKLNQVAKVLIDDGATNYKEYSGEIIWISNKSEFTPKTIQTKEERANTVYAIKIKVKNDGLLKIGMYGEVKF